ncbi:hypothetical protein K435DRAFT_675017, partial [Dendrothele bispora CBS 962.96]
TNHSQFLTRESNDMRNNPEDYHRVCDALEDVLRWVVEKVRRHPDLFARVEAEIDIFPLQDSNPVHPFSSFVLNINVMTEVHRDKGDKNGCIVLVLGQHQGGDICFQEAKLVVETAHGDMVTFCSDEVTHFLLPYKGVRASVVIHSDKISSEYQKNGCGWDSNNYMV